MATQKAFGVIFGLYLGYVRVILGLYWGYIRVILGLYWDNGKENGNHYLRLRVRVTQEAQIQPLYC